jgi:hypothetical protein
MNRLLEEPPLLFSILRFFSAYSAVGMSISKDRRIE